MTRPGLAPLFFFLSLASFAFTGCGGSGGEGGAGGCGAALVGDEDCVAAQTYVDCEECASDGAVVISDWPIPLTGCMDDNPTKLCVNCINFSKFSATSCLLTGDCASECAAIHQ